MSQPPIETAAAPPVGVENLSIENAGKTETGGATEQNIDPWSVSAGTDADGNELEFNYESIAQKWNTKLIDKPLLERFERLTGKKPHRWLRRGLFFSHRDFNIILDNYEQGKEFFLYTGRGPSSDSIHVGHTIPFEFTKWLQDVFDVPLVIMLTDDEKSLFKDGYSLEETTQFSLQNAKDFIALGFDPKKTFIYSVLQFYGNGGGHLHWNALEFSKLMTFNQVRGAFGFGPSTNTGCIFYPNVQCAAAFATSYPFIWGEDPYSTKRAHNLAGIQCLIPCAIDQDPYFRLLRDACGRMKPSIPKPALIHSKFLTSLQGPGGKMSASNPNSAIFMSDTQAQIKKKINKFAFSGGQATLELHRELGGNPDSDVAFQYLQYFDDDDEKLDRLAEEYRKGELLSGEMKKLAVELLQKYVGDFQARRALVTDEILAEYMRPRKLEWTGGKTAKKQDAQPSSPS